MSKRKANIRPELVGELFTDGKDYFKLVRCETEPKAVMIDLSNPAVELEHPVSAFSDLVRLKPIRPIEKPKKPRADSGGTHKKPAASGKKQKMVDEPEIADKKGDHLTIHVPTGLKGDTEYKVNIAGSEASGSTLRGTVLVALAGWDDNIPDGLTEQEQATIQGILDGE